MKTSLKFDKKRKNMLRTIVGCHFLKIKKIKLHTFYGLKISKTYLYLLKKKKHFLKAQVTVYIVCIH